ncbi:MAG: MFS transporter [Desulfobulbaceae bacterium]
MDSANNTSRNSFFAIHYGWFIMATGTLCLFASLGLGRFSLGMLLPSMGDALHLSYTQMGLIGTLNFIGYLIAVLLCGKITKRFGARRLIGTSLAVIGLSMLLISRATNLYLILALYLVTGIGSGLSNVPMVSLISCWFSKNKRGRATGFVTIGSGFAIVLSGKLIPYLNTIYEQGWRVSWFTLGIIVLAVAALSSLVLRNSPQECGLLPVGATGPPPLKGASPHVAPTELRSSIILHCAAIYFLFGFTYVIYATFIVTTLVQEKGFSETVAGNFWSWVGLLSLFSGPVFGSLSDRFGRRPILMLVFAIQVAAYLMIGLDLPQIFLYLSIGCYGIVVWSIPSIMPALVADYVGPERVASLFGFVTFIFGLGQIIGPFLAGSLAEISGSFSSSFLLAAFLAGSGIVLSALLPKNNTGAVR